MQELLEKARTEKFGDIVEIAETEFVDQVTKASEEFWVVIHLYKDG